MDRGLNRIVSCRNVLSSAVDKEMNERCSSLQGATFNRVRNIRKMTTLSNRILMSGEKRKVIRA